MSLNTTPIEKLSKNKKEKIIERESNDFVGIIFDMDENIDKRISALDAHYTENGENTIEIINKLCIMYNLSGTRLLENFLQTICDTSRVSVLLKLITAKSLISFKQKHSETSDDEDQSEKTTHIDAGNERRRLNGFRVLNDITMKMDGISTPQQLDAIFTLMEAPEYKNESLERFRTFLGNHAVPCDYRYRTILVLELDGKGGEWERKIPDQEFFLRESLFFFIHDGKNMTTYKILAGQYMLQNLRKMIDDEERRDIQNILLSVAQDDELDFNIRADAADTLLNVGDEECVTRAREIITLLSFAMGQRRTLFDNTQNVHVTEIEESVMEILSSIMVNTHMLKMESGENVTFEFVRNKIEEMLVITKGKKCISPCKHTKCEMCDNCVIRENSVCCDDDCDKNLSRKTKIIVSLNRIAMDRILYSKYSVTLSGILLRVWSYICKHKSCDEMRKRLLEELYDMSGTCSSGFASRLINVLSGFGDFSIRISWCDQIIANFTGRLNALARKIDHSDSVYLTDKSHHSDLVMLYLSANPDVQKILKDETKEDVVKKYLKTNRKKKINLIVEEFKANVLVEMAINTENTSSRANFLKFFRDNMLKIREEMYMEFREHMTDVDFDLWFRAAIMSYETGHTD